MYYNNYADNASLAGLFDLLLDKDTPALHPAVRITTTAEKFAAFLPDALLACISPAESGSSRSNGGRPRKAKETSQEAPAADFSAAEASAPDQAHAPAVSREWRTSSYLPFLYNAYKQARARRKVMAGVLRANPASVLLAAEEKAQAVLYKKGVPCFDQALLEKVLTDPSCIPFRAPDVRDRYLQHLRYYLRTNPEKAFSRAFLSLLLAEQSEDCMDLLFPSIEYSAEDGTSLLLYADQLFESGRYKEAKDRYQAVLDDPQNPDRDTAALRIGRMYLYGYGFDDAQSGAYALFLQSLKLGGDSPLPDTLYELYLCERDGIGTPGGRKDDELAFRHLLAATAGKCIPALLEIGGMYYAGNKRFHIDADKEKAGDYYLAGAEKGDPACEMMCGRCLQDTGRIPEARYWYYQAARRGNVEASLLLAELDLTSQSATNTEMSIDDPFYADAEKSAGDSLSADTEEPADESAASPAAGLCFFTAENEMTETFCASLPSGWKTFPLAAFEETLRGGIADNAPLMLVWIADRDSRRNLRDLHRILDFLEHLSLDNRKKKVLIEKIHFYVRTEGDDNLAVKMIDSLNSVNELRQKLADSQRNRRTVTGDHISAVSLQNFSVSAVDQQDLSICASGRRDWHYHIRICNPERDASQYLLSRAPLFLPCLVNSREQPHILILGGGKIVPRLVCDALSVFPFTKDGKPLSITVLSENAETVREEIEERMPELTSPKSHISCNLQFFALSGHELWELFVHGKLESAHKAKRESNREADQRMNPEEDSAVGKELQKILYEANYYIVAGDDDAANVETAARLRGALLSSVSDFEKLPFIAAYVRDNLLAQQADHFSVINEGIGFSWYNNYNLFCFGSSQQLYTYRELEEGYMERRALALHLSYYTEDMGSQRQGVNDYWCRFYNRDSSHMAALSAIYKAYLAGIVLEEREQYGLPVFESTLADKIEKWLADPQNRENAARAEHNRWVCFACSRGWRHASVRQMRAYLQMGNPRQQLYLAQLHPCIVSWQELPGMQEEYNAIRRQRNPDWKDRDFIRSDYDILEAVPKLLRMK